MGGAMGQMGWTPQSQQSMGGAMGNMGGQLGGFMGGGGQQGGGQPMGGYGNYGGPAYGGAKAMAQQGGALYGFGRQGQMGGNTPTYQSPLNTGTTQFQ
jgi:hypothetical protein